MKKLILILFFTAQLIPLNTCCAESEIFKKINFAINLSLPEKWEVLSIEHAIIPRWSFSEDKCWLIKVFGPNMSGRQYYDKHPLKGGKILGKKKIFNESIFIWVGNEDFNPKLSLLNRIMNHLNIVPKEIPVRIFKYKKISVYANENLVTLPHNEHIWHSSMPDAPVSGYWEFEDGRSWPNWIGDIKKNLKECFSGAYRCP